LTQGVAKKKGTGSSCPGAAARAARVGGCVAAPRAAPTPSLSSFSTRAPRGVHGLIPPRGWADDRGSDTMSTDKRRIRDEEFILAVESVHAIERFTRHL